MNSQRTIDVTGLPEEAIAALESLVDVIRKKDLDRPSAALESQEEWSKRLHNWAAGHPVLESPADDSRDRIYEGRGE